MLTWCERTAQARSKSPARMAAANAAQVAAEMTKEPVMAGCSPELNGRTCTCRGRTLARLATALGEQPAAITPAHHT